jgi:hypothetical protein
VPIAAGEPSRSPLPSSIDYGSVVRTLSANGSTPNRTITVRRKATMKKTLEPSRSTPTRIVGAGAFVLALLLIALVPLMAQAASSPSPLAKFCQHKKHVKKHRSKKHRRANNHRRNQR